MSPDPGTFRTVAQQHGVARGEPRGSLPCRDLAGSFQGSPPNQFTILLANPHPTLYAYSVACDWLVVTAIVLSTIAVEPGWPWIVEVCMPMTVADSFMTPPAF